MANALVENKDLVLFESNRIRRQFYNGEWYYSVVDMLWSSFFVTLRPNSCHRVYATP